MGQIVSFFEDGAHMVIPHATFAQLLHDVISTVSDLVDFDKESIHYIADNLRSPVGRVHNPQSRAVAGAPPFVFGAKYQTCLEVACDLVRFYEPIGRPLTMGNIKWSPLMRKFGLLWKSLVAYCIAGDRATLMTTKELSIMKRCETFGDHLCRYMAVRRPLCPTPFIMMWPYALLWRRLCCSPRSGDRWV